MDAPEPTAAEVRWTFKVVGACALILTFALAYGIVHKVNQSDDIVRIAAANADQVQRLTAQLDERDRVDAVRDRLDKARAKQAARERARQLHQTRLLVRILRKNGISIPAEAFTAPTPGTSTTRPKAHRPTSRATPTPTAPSPSPSHRPSPAYCQVVPALCDGLPLSLPTVLPKEAR